MNGKDFQKLKAHWDQKLKDSGFVDIEDSKGNLKQYNRRTIAFENREAILEFFLKLDTYLSKEPQIPDHHRQILNLYSQGKKIVDISKTTKKCDASVRNVIRKYKKLIQTGQL